MYARQTSLVLGFHGCDQKVADAIIASGDSLRVSTNRYDWLGSGIYFWEHSPARALAYAEALHQRPKRAKQPISAPAVIGAIIDPGHCLDLTEYASLALVKQTYEAVRRSFTAAGLALPANKPGSTGADLLRRELDCLVIESLHRANLLEAKRPIDSVRGVFWEGDELYPNAGFREKNHVQLCVRNPNCIKGYFRPRSEDSHFPAV